jgi:hypothetical protein
VDASSATLDAVRRAGFSVVWSPTAGDTGHHTLILPKPVTKDVADIFNALFGRQR